VLLALEDVDLQEGLYWPHRGARGPIVALNHYTGQRLRVSGASPLLVSAER
jgi:hypothetical protein